MKLIERGALVTVNRVMGELEGVDGAAHKRLKAHDNPFVVSRFDVDFYLRLGQITHKYPAMCGARGPKEKADGYVVTFACMNNLTVVSDESRLSRRRRKIPWACAQEGVPCIDLATLIEREQDD